MHRITSLSEGVGPGTSGRGSKAQPRPEAQHKFTDPESRIMKGPDGFVQGYNAQIAVESAATDRRSGIDATGE